MYNSPKNYLNSWIVSSYWIFDVIFSLNFNFRWQKNGSWCGKGHYCNYHRRSCTKKDVRLYSLIAHIYWFNGMHIKIFKKTFICNLPLVQVPWWICWEELWSWRWSDLQVWTKLRLWPLYLLKSKIFWTPPKAADLDLLYQNTWGGRNMWFCL